MNQNVLRLPEGIIGPVKMVIMDLDGTALDPDKKLTPPTLDALSLLKKRGIPYTFASARTVSMMTLHCQRANVSGPIIAMEGAEIRIWETGNTLCHFPIEQNVALALMEFCHNIGLDYTFYTPYSAYFRQNTQRLQRFRRYNDQATAAGLLPVSCLFYEAYSPQSIAAQQILKVCVMAPDDVSRTAIQAFLKQHPALCAERSEDSLISIVAAKVSKADTIELLCKMQGIGLQDICCFGDYYNDIGMLSQAGYSVAMGNAPEEVRNAARYVTASNAEDGVAYFIRHHICGE